MGSTYHWTPMVYLPRPVLAAWGQEESHNNCVIKQLNAEVKKEGFQIQWPRFKFWPCHFLLCDYGLVTVPLCASVSLCLKWQRCTQLLLKQLGSVSGELSLLSFQNESPDCHPCLLGDHTACPTQCMCFPHPCCLPHLSVSPCGQRPAFLCA